jgi:uncharacterized membrane protein
MDLIRRTVAKTVSWRAWVIITTSIVGWLITGDVMKGLSIGVMTSVVNTIAYIIHERIWSRIRWGQQ